MPAASIAVDRGALRDRFRRSRARTRALFDLLDPAAYYERPIRLRNPIVFYEGHLPAFAVNTMIRKGLGEAGIDAHFETIFARGIDPDEEAAAVARGNPAWPAREAVQAYAAEADRRLEEAIGRAPLEPLFTVLEHEEMHQETLAYIWHEAPYAWKRKPEHYRTVPPSLLGLSAEALAKADARVVIPAGVATLGTELATTNHRPSTTEFDHRPSTTEPFAWDNEVPSHQVHVAEFDVDVHNVTNAQYLDYMNQTGAAAPHFWEQRDGAWHWRGMFEPVPLPLDWPVYVTWAEADAYARWQGRRLMTEAEFHRAAYGTPDGGERRFPWGDEMPTRAPGNFDFGRFDPEPVGRHVDGASAFGVHDLVGNGWEWTADVFAPFAGFEPMFSYPEYSADFFDGQHYVMKGASPMTARALVRPGLRNWFRPNYPYVYATFRTVSAA
ncbi:MAG: SUMF1/EgtB/PvdO family nonheme iron enzyme [Vicinamibacterales bacterium]